MSARLERMPARVATRSQTLGFCHRGHFAATPTLSQWDTGLLIDQPGVGANHGVGPNVVLPYPRQSTRSQGGDVVAHQRLESDVASFGDQCSTDTQWQTFSSSASLADALTG